MPNYNKFSQGSSMQNKTWDKQRPEQIEQPKWIEAEDVSWIEQPAILESHQPSRTGKVVKCKSLNVRKEASTDADILCVINENSEILLLKEIDEDWFHVCTEVGIEGYVMSKFVEV